MRKLIRKAGGTAMADGADVSNFEQVKAMVERATKERQKKVRAASSLDRHAGNASEFNTLLVTDWFAHTPPSVLASNFGVPAETFAKTPLPNL